MTDLMRNLQTVDISRIRQPSDVYQVLGQRRPLVWASIPGFDSVVCVVTGYNDVRALLSDRRFVTKPVSGAGVRMKDRRSEIAAARDLPSEYLDFVVRSVLNADGGDHIRLRRAVSRALTTRRISRLRYRVDEIAHDLLDALPGKTVNCVVDLDEHFNYAFPATVMCELVGIPKEDWTMWREWGRGLTSIRIESIGAAVKSMVEYIRKLIDWRQNEPQDDLISDLIGVQAHDTKSLSEVELITIVLAVFIAGHETTALLLSNGILALLDHPDQLALLRDDLSLAPQAVHELIRWCSPIQAAGMRYPMEELVFGGYTMTPGEPVLPLLIAANHDPRVFSLPEELDISRAGDKGGESHVGFGAGFHYCLGATVARVAGEAAFRALVGRYPHLQLAVSRSRLRRLPVPLISRWASLPVNLG